ncbi:hypothetical protein RS694_09445 [Rhodoferax saidenbachensis]|uniref:EAL domain-containing protein n=1 Tax=Rhodoferax saidenbachensis TaxID=1484693 RepID=A0A1P8KFM1_9BURK|nr:hypothetical protein RS694_09445 [Rhodoferax saidenbachensis]
MRMMLWMGGYLLITVGLCWGVYFAMQHEWFIVALDALMFGVGVQILVWTRRKRTRRAFYLLMGSIFWVVFGISAVFDIPSAAAPRSTHLFLLTLAVCALLFLRDERGPLRHLMAGLCFIAFVALASTNHAWIAGYALPDTVRVGGTWVNVIFSMGAVYAMVYIMMSDVAGASEQETELRKGIANGEFFLVYQPQVASSGQVLGAEALLRWKHPKRGLVGPAEFIGLAEESRLILPLGLLALEMACEELVAWSQKPALSELTLSVNVSAQQFHEPDFVNAVRTVMERCGVQPNRLKLELTESLLANDLDDIVAKMESLKAFGVGFSLDDFGTGYSSLNYLKRLPLDQLKIDQSFVQDVLTDPNDAAIARTVITLGQSMGFAVIAEGVETIGQRDFLMANGCHTFQGYLFGRPMTAKHFAEFVTRGPVG